MCFSPEASLVASAFLAIMSIANFVKIKYQGLVSRKKMALLLVPVGFAVQQLCEGLVWLSLLHNYSTLTLNIATYGFMFFAFIFWPAYIPWCMCYLETNEIRKDVLNGFSWIGSVLALILLLRLMYYGVVAQLANCHIMYNSGMADWSVITIIMMVMYLLVTVGSLLVSSFPGMRKLGVLVGFAYLVAYLFYLNFLISVWCFFAAIISLVLYRFLN